MASSYVSVFHIGELSYKYKMHNFLIQGVLNILRQKKKRKVLLLYHIIDECTNVSIVVHLAIMI